MKKGLLIKILIDIVMTTLLLLLIGYHLLESQVHEWLGIGVFGLFIIHNILNWRWYKNLFKGKYTCFRILQTILNFILWIVMICTVISSVYISGYIFSFLNLNTTRFSRALHLVSTIWLFILVSFHTGFHWQMMISIIKNKTAFSDKTNQIIKIVLRIILAVLCFIGLYVFIIRKLWEEIFLTTEFKWYDYEKTVIIYFLESLCMMILFASASYYLKKTILFVKKNSARKKVPSTQEE